MPWLLMLLPILVGTIFTDAKFENVFVAISIYWPLSADIWDA